MRDLIRGESPLEVNIDDDNQVFVLSGSVSISDTQKGVSGVAYEVSTADVYTGSYSFTPSGEEQTIPISGLLATENIVIAAIPNNYGLVSWNGAYLTIE